MSEKTEALVEQTIAKQNLNAEEARILRTFARAVKAVLDLIDLGKERYLSPDEHHWLRKAFTTQMLMVLDFIGASGQLRITCEEMMKQLIANRSG